VHVRIFSTSLLNQKAQSERGRIGHIGGVSDYRLIKTLTRISVAGGQCCGRQFFSLGHESGPFEASVDVTGARDAEEEKTRNRSLAIVSLIFYPDGAG
jgi:hypothetical protein